jgi:DNA polymerase III subunit gamma/tau
LLVAKTAPDRRDLVTITEATWSELCEVAQQLEMHIILAGQQHLRTCEPQVKNTTQPRLWLEVALLGLLPGVVASAAPAANQVQRPLPSSPSAQPVAILPATQPASPPQASPTAPSTPASSRPAAASVSLPVTAASSVAVSQPVPDVPPPPVPPTQGGLVTSGSPVANQQPVPSAAEPSITDLGQMWQQMLAHLHPAGRALFKQHGSLLAFGGNQARIGVPKGLVPTAQTKLAEVESALQALVNRPVKVNLVINTPAQTSSPPATAVPSNPLPAAQSSAAEPLPPRHQPSTPPPQDSFAAPVESLKEPFSPAEPPDAMPAQADLGLGPPIWETEDELTQTARSFANFFGGALVADAPDAEVTTDVQGI